MLFIFMGSSCTGKSSAAEELKKLVDVKIYAGKDYLRMAKSENDAWKLFYEKLKEASKNKELDSDSIIYIVSEKNQISKLESLEDAITVKFTADLDVIKSRFAKRMNGNLPEAVEKMIERHLIDWENVNAELYVDTSSEVANEVAKKVYAHIKRVAMPQ